MKAQRNSCVEILRLIAMVLIVFGHQIDVYTYSGVGGVVDFAGVFPTTDPVFFILSFVGPLGLMGDVIFIACSAYFLVESDRISVKKIFYLLSTDVIIMCAALAVKAVLGDPISTKNILEAIFPTFLQVNWFVGYYIVFYLLHPFFNYVIRKLDKKGLAIVTAILFIQCNVIAFGMGDTPGSLGLKLMSFISIYFAVAFYKKYGGKIWESKRINVIVLISSVVLYIVFRIVINHVGLSSEYLAERQYGYSHINNPIILIMALSMINLASRKEKHNKVINYFAVMSLLLYIIHKNLQVFFHYDYIGYFLDTYGADTFIFAVFTKSLIVLGLGIILSIIYRHTVYYGVMWAGGKLENLINAKIDAFKIKRQQKANLSTTDDAEEAVNESQDEELKSIENDRTNG